MRTSLAPLRPTEILLPLFNKHWDPTFCPNNARKIPYLFNPINQSYNKHAVIYVTQEKLFSSQITGRKLFASIMHSNTVNLKHWCQTLFLVIKHPPNLVLFIFMLLRYFDECKKVDNRSVSQGLEFPLVIASVSMYFKIYISPQIQLIRIFLLIKYSGRDLIFSVVKLCHQYFIKEMGYWGKWLVVGLVTRPYSR